MDQWLQIFSLIALLCIAIMELYSSHSGVRCWCPAQFTASHVHYTDAYCSDLQTPRYQTLPEKVDSANPVPRLQPLPYNLSKDKTLLKCVGLEALLAFTLYSIIEVLKACVSVDVSLPQGSHRSHSKAPLYVLAQATGAILWTLLAALTYLAYDLEAVSEALTPFLCQFQMQYQLRLHTYLVQCKDTGGGGMLSAVNANIGLAIIVAFAKVVHIIMCFIVQPRLKRDKDGMVPQGFIFMCSPNAPTQCHRATRQHCIGASYRPFGLGVYQPCGFDMMHECRTGQQKQTWSMHKLSDVTIGPKTHQECLFNTMCIKLKEHKLIKDSREMGSCFAMSDLYFAMLVTGADVMAGPQGPNNNVRKP